MSTFNFKTKIAEIIFGDGDKDVVTSCTEVVGGYLFGLCQSYVESKKVPGLFTKIVDKINDLLNIHNFISDNEKRVSPEELEYMLAAELDRVLLELQEAFKEADMNLEDYRYMLKEKINNDFGVNEAKLKSLRETGINTFFNGHGKN